MSDDTRDKTISSSFSGAARALVEQLQEFVQHKDNCPQAYDRKWAGIRHTEQHLDEDDMRKCPDPVCVAWNTSAMLRWEKVDCTCGLSALLVQAGVPETTMTVVVIKDGKSEAITFDRTLPGAQQDQYLNEVADRILEMNGAVAHDWLCGVAKEFKKYAGTAPQNEQSEWYACHHCSMINGVAHDPSRHVLHLVGTACPNIHKKRS